MEPQWIEERISLLEALANEQAGILLDHAVRLIAIEQLLSEQELLNRVEVERRVTAIKADVDETVELSPRYQDFRRWRRQLEARRPAPDDQ